MAYTRSIVQIQTWWRGRSCFIKFQKVWEKHVPKDTRVRRRKLERKLESLSTTAANPHHHRLALPPLGTSKLASQLDLFLEGLDAGNAVAAEYIQQALNKLTLPSMKKRRGLDNSTSFWKAVMDKILQRGVIDCVICLHGICLKTIMNSKKEQEKRQLMAKTSDCNHNHQHPSVSASPTTPILKPASAAKKGKKVVVFGCSHILHAPCFSIYEKSLSSDPLFSPSSSMLADGQAVPAIACPVCRAPTAKRKYLTTIATN